MTSHDILEIRASQVLLVVKKPHANVGDTRDVGSVRGWGTSPGGGHGNPLQCSCLKNSVTGEPGRLQSIGSQSQTQLKQLSTHACIDFFKKNLKLENSHMSVLSLGCMA